MALADPDALYPVVLKDGTVHKGTVHLRVAVDHPGFEVGDWTYANDFSAPEDPADWAPRLAPYLYPWSEAGLRIGKFGQIAHGVRFITAGANHAHRGITTYPFPSFDGMDFSDYDKDERPIEVGHDVWFGTNAMVMAGARIGSGAIVGAGAVVRGEVPPFSVVIGNPATVVRTRFSAEDIESLLEIAWWNWAPERIDAARPALLKGDVRALRGL